MAYQIYGDRIKVWIRWAEMMSGKRKRAAFLYKYTAPLLPQEIDGLLTYLRKHRAKFTVAEGMKCRSIGPLPSIDQLCEEITSPTPWSPHSRT